MPMMRLTAEFLIPMETPRGLAANDNRLVDEDFVFRNLVATELTYALARIERGEGVP